MATRTTMENTDLTRLREEVSRLVAERESAEARFDERLRRELDRQREELDRELVRRAYRIAELEQKVDETGETYESTLSWKVTGPIRSGKALLAKFLRR